MSKKRESYCDRCIVFSPTRVEMSMYDRFECRRCCEVISERRRYAHKKHCEGCSFILKRRCPKCGREICEWLMERHQNSAKCNSRKPRKRQRPKGREAEEVIPVLEGVPDDAESSAGETGTAVLLEEDPVLLVATAEPALPLSPISISSSSDC